ncbi:MAG: peptide-methionine (S)-S-oxide reductase [Bacteroidia bacterium]|jgi:peptide-methionine (S)-S-oxide reductase
MLRYSLLVLALLITPSLVRAETATAYFAGGCFWCMEAAYQEHVGVTDAVSGFTGGTMKNPTYSGNHDGHYEAVKVTYDPDLVSYQTLLDFFWRNVDPFDNSGQFCDKGFSYRSAIFGANDDQQLLAQASKLAVTAQFPGRTVHTEILDAGEFWPVEEGHQDYYLKNPTRYKYYRWGCGRDQRLQEIWGDQAAH